MKRIPGREAAAGGGEAVAKKEEKVRNVTEMELLLRLTR